MPRNPNIPDDLTPNQYTTGRYLAHGIFRILRNKPLPSGRQSPFPFQQFTPGQPLIPNERGVNMRFFSDDAGKVGISLGMLYSLEMDPAVDVADGFDDLNDFRQYLHRLDAPCFTLSPMQYRIFTSVCVWQAPDGTVDSIPPATITLPSGDARAFKVSSTYIVSWPTGHTLRLSQLYAYTPEDDADRTDVDVVSEGMQRLLAMYGGNDSGGESFALLATQAYQVTDADEFESLGAYLADIEGGNLQPQQMHLPPTP